MIDPISLVSRSVDITPLLPHLIDPSPPTLPSLLVCSHNTQHTTQHNTTQHNTQPKNQLPLQPNKNPCQPWDKFTPTKHKLTQSTHTSQHSTINFTFIQQQSTFYHFNTACHRSGLIWSAHLLHVSFIRHSGTRRDEKGRYDTSI